MQATIPSSELEKLSNASVTSQEGNRPHSRTKTASSAGKKKKQNAAVTPTTGNVPNSVPGTAPGQQSSGTQETLEFTWNLRIIATDNTTILVSKDTEKEDRYRAIKESWEVAAVGRMNRARELRENYLKGIESGSVKPVLIKFEDESLKPWTVIKQNSPKVMFRRDTELKVTEPRLTLTQRLLAQQNSSNPFVTQENKDETNNVNANSVIESVTEKPVVLNVGDFEQRAVNRSEKIQMHQERHTETVKTRISEKERRAAIKKKFVEIVETKLRELEFWEKFDQERREGYRQKLIAEAEESNAKLRAALDAASKAAEALEDEQSDKKKKVGKK